MLLVIIKFFCLFGVFIIIRVIFEEMFLFVGKFEGRLFLVILGVREMRCGMDFSGWVDAE